MDKRWKAYEYKVNLCVFCVKNGANKANGYIKTIKCSNKTLTFLKMKSCKLNHNEAVNDHRLDNGYINTKKTIDSNTQQVSQYAMQLQLAQCYLVLAKLKKEVKFYNLAQKLIKPYANQGKKQALLLLISLCTYRNEPALSKFYLKILFHHEDFNHADFQQVNLLESVKNSEWYQQTVLEG